jgi:hypothetical protein
MKLKSLVFLAVLLITVPAAYSQDQGAPDSVKLVVTSLPPVIGLPLQPFTVACSVFVDADNLASMTFGWKWDDPNLQMDSARAFGDFAAMNLIFFYLDDQIATTNDSQIAVLNGVSFGSGYPPAPAWRLCATYYMTLANWTTARGSINIDSVTHPSYTQTEYIFAPVSTTDYKPIWGGPINISTSGVDESDLSNIPATFELQQNYPNPFNPTTKIKYGLPTKSHMTLKVYNLLGQEINTLVDQVVPAGTHETQWDGKDKTGVEVATGIYFYKLVAGDFVETKKMMLVK